MTSCLRTHAIRLFSIILFATYPKQAVAPIFWAWLHATQHLVLKHLNKTAHASSDMGSSTSTEQAPEGQTSVRNGGLHVFEINTSHDSVIGVVGIVVALLIAILVMCCIVKLTVKIRTILRSHPLQGPNQSLSRPDQPRTIGLDERTCLSKRSVFRPNTMGATYDVEMSTPDHQSHQPVQDLDWTTPRPTKG